jgi:hypothetical protein
MTRKTVCYETYVVWTVVHQNRYAFTITCKRYQYFGINRGEPAYNSLKEGI